MKTNFKKYSLQDYLIGEKIDTKKENLFGTILGFQKKIGFNEVFKTYNHFAFLLFFDHRTGRIERYLINSANIKENIFKEKIEGYNDIFSFKGEKYRLLNESEHIMDDHYENFRFSNLHDGKLSRKFFNVFFFELYRDYLIYEKSYINGNMAYLRDKTVPITQEYYDKTKNTLILAKGTGAGIVKENLIPKSMGEFLPFTSKTYLEINSNLPKIIYIPKIFKSDLFNSSLELNNFIFKPVLINECPQCIKDLRRTISIRDISNSADLNRKIRIFNDNIVKKLDKLENS